MIYSVTDVLHHGSRIPSKFSEDLKFFLFSFHLLAYLHCFVVGVLILLGLLLEFLEHYPSVADVLLCASDSLDTFVLLILFQNFTTNLGLALAFVSLSVAGVGYLQDLLERGKLDVVDHYLAQQPFLLLEMLLSDRLEVLLVGVNFIFFETLW